MTRDTYTHADRLNGHPETPRQKTERYRAAVEITGATATPETPENIWLPFYRLATVTGILFAAVTAAVIWSAL